MTCIGNKHRFGIIVCCAVLACGLLTAAGAASKDKSSGALADQIRGMKPEDQVKYLLDAKARGENTPELHFLIGVALYSSGLVDSCESYFRQAIDMDSTYTRAYVNLGIVLDTQRKSVEAEFMYKKALELNPGDELANCHLGFIFHTRGEHEEAIKYYLEALRINPNSAQAHYNLGLAFADARIFREALAEWEKVIELEPDGALGQTAKENVNLIKQYLETEVK